MVREFKYFKGNTVRSKNYYFIIGGSYLMLPYVGYRSENYMNGLIEHVRSVYRNFEVNEGTINNIKGAMTPQQIEKFDAIKLAEKFN